MTCRAHPPEEGRQGLRWGGTCGLPTCGLPVGHLWITCGLPVDYLWVTCGLGTVSPLSPPEESGNSKFESTGSSCKPRWRQPHSSPRYCPDP